MPLGNTHSRVFGGKTIRWTHIQCLSLLTVMGTTSSTFLGHNDRTNTVNKCRWAGHRHANKKTGPPLLTLKDMSPEIIKRALALNAGPVPVY